jgi:hypothetical protein
VSIDNPSQGFASIRELHEVERRITEAIQEALDKVERNYGPSTKQVERICSVAEDAAKSAANANARIDSLQKLLIPLLFGWLLTALGSAWGLWRALTAIKELGL